MQLGRVYMQLRTSGQSAEGLDKPGGGLDPQSVDSDVCGKGPLQTLLKAEKIGDDVGVLFKKECHA